MTMERNLKDFSIDDFVVFSRKFEKSDFNIFSKLSGDNNPLHHDLGYARESQFSEPIIPVWLLSSPISMVAGTMLPGHRALILSNEMRAISPGFYGRDLHYSSKVVDIHPANRVLSIRTLALHDDAVLLDSLTKVQVRDDVPRGIYHDGDLIKKNSHVHSSVLVSGASGAIGHAIALKLAEKGLSLVLTGRDEAKLKTLSEQCKAFGIACSFFAIDLLSVDDVSKLKSTLVDHPDIGAFIHAASSGIDASLDDLMSVNYVAFKEICQQMVPGFLRRQKGCVIFIGSSATMTQPLGWENYTVSKVSGASFIDALNLRYGEYGLKGFNLAPGFVDTSFSRSFRPRKGINLMPEEVAEATVELLNIRDRKSGTLWLTPEGKYWVGPQSSKEFNLAKPDILKKEQNDAELGDRDIGKKLDTLRDLFIRFFKLTDSVNLDNAALGSTPGWDSLRHIEFLLFLEGELSVNFESAEIEKTTHLSDLEKLLVSKLQG